MPNVLKPIPGKVVVKLDTPEERSAGGIILPENARDNCNVGTVEAVIREGWWEQGAFLTPLVHVGDRVIIGKYAGVDVLVDQIEYTILKQSDILAILEEVPVASTHG